MTSTALALASASALACSFAFFSQAAFAFASCAALAGVFFGFGASSWAGDQATQAKARAVAEKHLKSDLFMGLPISKASLLVGSRKGVNLRGSQAKGPGSLWASGSLLESVVTDGARRTGPQESG